MFGTMGLKNHGAQLITQMDGMERDPGDTVRVGIISNFASTYFAIARAKRGDRTEVSWYLLEIAGSDDDLTGPRSFTRDGFVRLVTTIRQFLLHGKAAVAVGPSVCRHSCLH